MYELFVLRLTHEGQLIKKKLVEINHDFSLFFGARSVISVV